MDEYELKKKWQEVSKNETVISKDSVTGISKDNSGNNDLKNLTRAEFTERTSRKKS